MIFCSFCFDDLYVLARVSFAVRSHLCCAKSPDFVSACYIPFGIVLFFFVDYWSGYEVGRLRRAVVIFKKEHFAERGRNYRADFMAFTFLILGSFKNFRYSSVSMPKMAIFPLWSL